MTSKVIEVDLKENFKSFKFLWNDLIKENNAMICKTAAPKLMMANALGGLAQSTDRKYAGKQAMAIRLIARFAQIMENAIFLSSKNL